MRKAKIIVAILAVVILSGFTYLALNSGVAADGQLKFGLPKLQSTEDKLKDINIQYEKLNTKLKTQSSTDKENIDKLKAQQEQLQKEKQDLESKLQAKAAQKQALDIAAANATKTLTATQTASAEAVPTYSGSHEDWMAQAGISASDYAAVDYIVSHESGWNPGAVNASSGATGLCQALPGSKMASAGSDWASNPVTQLKWCTGYAAGRYGGWWGAYDFWLANHWW